MAKRNHRRAPFFTVDNNIIDFAARSVRRINEFEVLLQILKWDNSVYKGSFETDQQMASYIGCSRGHVNRSVRNLIGCGLVVPHGQFGRFRGYLRFDHKGFKEFCVHAGLRYQTGRRRGHTQVSKDFIERWGSLKDWVWKKKKVRLTGRDLWFLLQVIRWQHADQGARFCVPKLATQLSVTTRQVRNVMNRLDGLVLFSKGVPDHRSGVVFYSMALGPQFNSDRWWK